MNLETLGALIDGDGIAETLDAENAFDALADELRDAQDQLQKVKAERDELFSQLRQAFNLIEALNCQNSELRAVMNRVDGALEAVRKVRET